MSAVQTNLQPTTGRLEPVLTDEVDERCAQALGALKGIYVPHDKHRAIRSKINTLRISCLPMLGTGEAFEGRAVVEKTGAGKTTILKRLASETNATPTADGAINPYRVVYIEMKVAGTLNMLIRRILKKVGDPNWNKGNADDVRDRLEIAFEERKVELLIVDEVQHLKGASKDKLAIADELKGLLDSGIVPVVFAGTEKAKEFFEENVELAGRLGDLLDLSPAKRGSRTDRKNFRDFCRALDQEISKAGIFETLSAIAEPHCLTALITASGGHLGRVFRIVTVAVEHALRREAEFVEVYDLDAAVQTFAIPRRYCTENPFRKGQRQ